MSCKRVRHWTLRQSCITSQTCLPPSRFSSTFWLMWLVCIMGSPKRKSWGRPRNECLCVYTFCTYVTSNAYLQALSSAQQDAIWNPTPEWQFFASTSKLPVSAPIKGNTWKPCQRSCFWHDNLCIKLCSPWDLWQAFVCAICGFLQKELVIITSLLSELGLGESSHILCWEDSILSSNFMDAYEVQTVWGPAWLLLQRKTK